MHTVIMPIKFQTIVADPPWPFKDKLPGATRGAANNYNIMTIEDIKNFQLPELHDHCRLFLWRVAALQQEALNVIDAWGFTLKAELIWVKKTATGLRWFGMGRQVRNEHEVCLIAVKGKPQILSRSVRSCFAAKFISHSTKPDKFYEIVESLSPGPYVELFARRKRANWTCLGDEIN